MVKSPFAGESYAIHFSWTYAAVMSKWFPNNYTVSQKMRQLRQAIVSTSMDWYFG